MNIKLPRNWLVSMRPYSKFTLTDTMNTAMIDCRTDNVAVSFYKGLGFSRMGPGYELDAIEAFNNAIKLDTKKMYVGRIKKYLFKISTQREQ